ncbi:hypothetical protein BH11BAC2_BH11BAC2_26430 [soil metagenome]
MKTTTTLVSRLSDSVQGIGKLILAAGIIASISTGCKKDDNNNTTPTPGVDINIQDSITSNTTWTANNKYILNGFVYVTNGATLTIEAGTLITGDKASKGSLIIKRGSKIIAAGTVADPIVFTSNLAMGSRAPGDWGGIIVCGNAPVNLAGGEGLVEGGPDAYYGGNDAADNSGIISYVRIEFAGIAFQPNQEINGLTLGAVGTGTQIDHVQVSYSGDDSFEFFGGTVNAKYLVTYKGQDDDYDTDNGFSGHIQFAVAQRDPNIADASGSNGFESDNDAAGSANSPFTAVKFSNISIYGPKADTSTAVNSNFKRAAHIRRNSQCSIYNSVIAGFPVGLLVDGTSTEGNATNNLLQFRNNIISGCNTPLAVASGSTFDINAWFTTSGYNNTIQYDNSNLANDPFNTTTPDFLPKTGSPLLSGADFTGLTGFETVTYRGAFGTTNWTSGWTNFNPQNTDY